jgi:hypothetical protein
VLSAHHDSESCSKDKSSRNALVIELRREASRGPNLEVRGELDNGCVVTSGGL